MDVSGHRQKFEVGEGLHFQLNQLISSYLFCAKVDFVGDAKYGYELLDKYINIHEVAVPCTAQWQCKGEEVSHNKKKKDLARLAPIWGLRHSYMKRQLIGQNYLC